MELAQSLVCAVHLSSIAMTLHISQPIFALWCCTGGTALHTAVRCGAERAIQVLLDNHANTDMCDNDGYAPLHEAAEAANAELLLDRGADPNIQNTQNHLQPLHMAARHGSSGVCKLLLSAGADVKCCLQRWQHATA